MKTQLALLALGLAPLLAACSSTPAHPKATPSPSATTAVACQAAQSSTSPPGVSSSDPVLELASGLDEPDDVTFSGGELLVGEYGSGEIARLDGPEGPLQLLPATVPEVEGLALLGGSLYAANQQSDTLELVQGASTKTTLQLTPVPGQEGVDGIGTNGTQLIVPNSPAGTVLLVSPEGQVTSQLTGFERPTGVWAPADGGLLVADEDAATVTLVSADGTRQIIGRGIAEADDVAETPGGESYAISISAGTLVQMTPGAQRVIVSGLEAPQGLTLDDAGNPEVTEYSAGRVDVVVTTYQLLPPSGTAALAAGQPLCVNLDRAPGFTSPVVLAPGPGYRILHQPGTGDQGELLPSRCRQTSCEVDVRASAGTLVDQSWLSYNSSA